MRLSLYQLWLSVSHYLTWWHFRRALVFVWVDLFLLSFVRRGKSNAVMIIKFDHLGDYILARNFLRRVRECDAYKGRKIVLCASAALKEFVEQYDAASFDQVLWMDRKDMVDTVWKRFHHLRQAKALGPEIVIQFTYGAEAFSGDTIARASGAPTQFIHLQYEQPRDGSGGQIKRRASSLYQPLFNPDEIVFEFDHHRAVFALAVPGVEPPRDTGLAALPVSVPEIGGPFAILMPGASESFREWPTARFAEVARHLHETRGWRMVVLGTKTDAAKARAIREASGSASVLDLCGQLSLNQVVYLASLCEIGVTNDSGGIHVLAAVHRPGVAISNGGSFGFFHPYPKELRPSVTFVYPDAFYALDLSMDERKVRFCRRSNFSITDVTVSNVVDRLEALLHPPFRDPVHDLPH